MGISHMTGEHTDSKREIENARYVADRAYYIGHLRPDQNWYKGHLGSTVAVRGGQVVATDNTPEGLDLILESKFPGERIFKVILATRNPFMRVNDHLPFGGRYRVVVNNLR